MPTIRQLNKQPDPNDRVRMKIIEGPKSWLGFVYFSLTAIPTQPFTFGGRKWVIKYHKDNYAEALYPILEMVRL